MKISFNQIWAINICSPDTCWISTGTFPQSFVVTLSQAATIEEIAIETYNGDKLHLGDELTKSYFTVKNLILESSTNDKPKNFQEIGKSGK